MNKPINCEWQRAATVGAAGGGSADVSIWRRGKKFWRVVRNQRRRGCIVCKEARELCKRHEYCYDDDNDSPCNYCNNEEIHHLLKSNSNKECICDRKDLEQLLDKNKVIAANDKRVHSMYLKR